MVGKMDWGLLRCPMCHRCNTGGIINVPTHKVIVELLTSKTLSNRRPVYIKSLKYYLERFADKFPNIGHLVAGQIEHWLSAFKGQYTRQTWLNRISTLFSFAVRRGYLEKNPCDRIDRVTIDRRPPAILSPDQASRILESCPASCLTYFILATFHGIRPDEIMRLKWSDVNLETMTVKVDGKTRQRRIVSLEPSVMRLLVNTSRAGDKIAPSQSTVRRWKRGCRAILGTWQADILRHTAASYMLARFQDAQKVALILGNSPKILMTHYYEPVSKEDCAKFWSILTHQTR